MADIALIAALAGGATVAEAAKTAGVSERTAFRRLQDPAFQERLREAREGTIRRAVAMLAEMGTEAAATLRALLEPTVPPTVRLGAARAALELGARLRESEELARRVAELEAMVSELERRRQHGTARAN
jgi:hypothetical protein